MSTQLKRLLLHSLILALCLCWVGMAQADFRRDYVLGKKDLSREDWEKAAGRFRSAIEGKAESNQNERLSSTGFAPYLPYYNLGVALQGMGDCAGAAEAWQNSLSQGVVQNMADEHARLQAGLQVCKPQPSIDISPYMAQASGALNALDEATLNYASLAEGTDSGFAGEWAEKWLPAMNTAKDELTDLRQRLSVAQNASDVPAIEAIATEAATARASLEGTHSQAAARLAVFEEQSVQLAADRAAEAKRVQLALAKENEEKGIRDEERRQQQAVEESKRLAAIQEREAAQKQAREQSEALQRREQIATAQRSLRTELTSSEPLLSGTTGNANVISERAQLSTLAQTAQGMLDSGSVSDLENQAQAIRDGVRRYRQAIQEWEAGQLQIARRTPPPELKAVADAYFSGDYQTASRLADPAKYSDSRQKIQAHLFRSASLFNLYWLEGGNNAVQLERAGQDIAAIKRLNGDFSPYVAAFSPKFLEFYQGS